MSAPWSDKDSKGTIVSADEFMILDSQDANPSTKNKRVTRNVVATAPQTPTNPTIAGSLVDGTVLNNAVNVYVRGKYAYVVSFAGDSLSIIDISEPANPVSVGSLVDGTNLNGSIGVFVSGNFAYVLARGNNSLAVIDISDPTSPTIVGQVQDGVNMNQPQSVQVVGNFAYVVSVNSDSLTIVDISIPTSPVVVGSLIDATNMNGAFGLHVVGNNAYVVSIFSDSLAIVDVTDPTAPTLTASLIDATNLEEASSVYVVGKYAYVASFAADSLSIIDISDPNTTPTLISSLVDATNFAGAQGVAVFGNHAYVTGGISDSLAIVDISDPTTPVLTSSLLDGTNLNGANGVYVSGKYAYVAASTNDSLTIVDINGIDTSSANIGNIETGYISVANNAVIRNDLYSNNLNVGNNVLVDGSLIGVPNIPEFSTSKSYVPGDIVTNTGIVLRAITNITPSAFVQSEWIVNDGVGAKNVVQVFTEADFGIASGGEIPLANNTEFILCAPVTYTNTLFFDVGFEIMLRSFADEVNKLTFSGAGAVPALKTLDISGQIIAASDIGGGEVQFNTNGAHGLVAGDFVNVSGGDFPAYRILREEITAVTLNTFTLVTSFEGNETNGRFNQGANVIEIEEIIIQGDISTPNQTLFDITLAPFDDSEFFMFHLIAKNFASLGNVDEGGRVDFEASSFFNYASGMSFNDVEKLFFGSNFFDEPTSTTNIITITGTSTLFHNYSGCFFESHPSGFAFSLPKGGTPILEDVAEIHIHDCKDLNFVTSFFVSTGFTQKDVNMFVNNNGLQANSLHYAKANVGTHSQQLTNNTPVSLTTATWSFIDDERFTVDAGTGIITYNGLEDITITGEYKVLITEGGDGAVDLSSRFGLNGVTNVDTILESEMIRTLALNATEYFTGFFLQEITNGDTFQVVFETLTATNNLTFTNLTVILKIIN